MLILITQSKCCQVSPITSYFSPLQLKTHLWRDALRSYKHPAPHQAPLTSNTSGLMSVDDPCQTRVYMGFQNEDISAYRPCLSVGILM